MKNLCKIGEVCRRCQVTARTVRWYEECGLIAPQSVEGTAHKFYSDDAIAVIQSVKLLQELGYSLQAIRELIELAGSDHTQEKWITLKLRDELAKQQQILRDKIAQLSACEETVSNLLDQTASCPDCKSKDCAPCPKLKRLRTLGLS